MGDLVPVIDLDAPDAVRRIDHACRSVGFLSIIGHGVERSIVDCMLEATADFFALPLDEKLSLRPPRPDINRGYAAKGSEGLLYSLGVDGAPPDLFEAFNIGPDHWPEGDRVPGPDFERVCAPNVWPPRPPQFREALVTYFQAVQGLAHRLTTLFALALELDADFFEDKTDHSTDTMRVNHYERSAAEPAPRAAQFRMGAHTDYGIVTILYADAVPGLQIVGPDGQWHDVLAPDGAFLVNLGDLLAQWTNDRWLSTLHRVVPPGPSSSGPARRRSVAFFHDGNYDALIECLPTCHSADNPPRYPPVLAGEHVIAKLVGPRTLTVSEATSTTGDRPVR
ncbi:MAG TPA: 2-oxoglutarate and iron-dependent oxygenase domain-containing protein [Acidimicrobiales bacterium]|nr:2-oxoglutarate and iron-dependent oxygenase domain-containing protein [Acidimicrobiales bacterium]